jgi:hypothetical protein
MKEMFEPWIHPLSTWKTKSEFFVWLRSGLRSIWSDNILRKQWKASQLRPVTKEERLAKLFHPSTKNVGQCYLCKNWFAGSKLECDHIRESEGCYSFETAEKFLWHCAASDPENWALVCGPCHKIKSYSVAQGLDMEVARATKEAIKIENDKNTKEWLLSKGISPASNASLRRKQIVEYLTKENL